MKTIKRICKYDPSISTGRSKSRRRTIKKSTVTQVNPLLTGIADSTNNYGASVDDDVLYKDMHDLQTKAWVESKFKGPNREIFEQLQFNKISQAN